MPSSFSLSALYPIGAYAWPAFVLTSACILPHFSISYLFLHPGLGKSSCKPAFHQILPS